MRLETFFEKFDLFADAPNAVTKMRGLILELAVRGKLSDQKATDLDEPSWVRFCAARNIRDKHAHPVDEPLFEIPASWCWASLNEIGNTKPRNDAPDDAICSFIPMMLIPAEYGKEPRHEERLWGDLKKGYTHFSNGDVVMAKITPCFENGKSAHVDHLTGSMGAGTTELHVFRKSSEVIDPAFVLLYIKSPGFIERGVPRMTGSAGQKRVPFDYFASSPFPLPPPSEQKRIVARVNELMSLCDRLEAQQKEREARHVALSRAAIARFEEAPTPANLSLLFHDSYFITPTDLRKAVLGLAVQGRLVSQNLDDEPAELILEQIAKQKKILKAAGRFRQGKVSRPQSADEVPSQLPHGWSWVNVDSVCFKVTDGTHFTPKYVESGIRFVSAKDIVGGVLTFEQCKYISREEHDSLYRRCNPQHHDIVISKSGSIGTVALVEDREEFSLFESLALLKFDQHNLLPRYFACALVDACSRLTGEHIRGMAVKHLHLEMLRGLEFALPPVAEQQRILDKLDELMPLLDQLEQQLAASDSQARKLIDAAAYELLNPTAKVIEFPASAQDHASDRAAIGCYTIQRLKEHRSFGHTMNMKAVYMAQTHVGLPLDLQFVRKAAGPWHPWIEEFDAMGQREGWFTVNERSIGNGHTKYEYAPKPALKQKAAEAVAVLGEHKAEFDRLLGLFAGMNTEEAEIVATLFAAWNDFLIDGSKPTDEAIIREVRENWHESKRRFTPARLAEKLKWMRKHHLVPRGRGPRTLQQLTLGLK